MRVCPTCRGTGQGLSRVRVCFNCRGAGSVEDDGTVLKTHLPALPKLRPRHAKQVRRIAELCDLTGAIIAKREAGQEDLVDVLHHCRNLIEEELERSNP